MSTKFDVLPPSVKTTSARQNASAAAAAASVDFTPRALFAPSHGHKKPTKRDFERAQTLQHTQPNTFHGMLKLMKNLEMDCATQVTKDILSKTKQQIRHYVADRYNAQLDEDFNQQTVLQIALVTEALRCFGGEYKLRQMIDQGIAEPMPDIALVPYELRNAHKQQEKRGESQSKHKEEKDVAHFLGLDVVTALNRQLQPHERLSREDLESLVNQSDNLRLVLRNTNRGLHKHVDNLLLRKINEDTESASNDQERSANVVNHQEFNRLKSIANVIQQEDTQALIIAMNGQAFYAALREKLLAFSDRSGQVPWHRSRDKAALRTKKKETPKRQPKHQATTHRTQTIVSTTESTRLYSSNASPRDATSQGISHQSGIDRTYLTGPKGGTYYINAHGNAIYVKREEATEPSNLHQKRAPSTAAQDFPRTHIARDASPLSEREYQVGPRGGQYYVNDKGNKMYAKHSDHSSTSSAHPPPAPPASSRTTRPSSSKTSKFPGSSPTSSRGTSSTASDRVYHTGPRGGTYYINDSGRKVYSK